MTRVLLVGLGTIARTHLAVLAQLPGVEVVGGVDPAPPELPFPVFGSLAEGLASTSPDLVVLATPTDTHVPLATQALAATSGLVLSEKPLARTAAELSGLPPERVRVAHHFAFSPEVEWARAYVAARGLGAPQRVQSVFNDPYGALPAAQRESLVSAWVDSGPNQLSIVDAFVSGLAVREHAAVPERAVTTLSHDGGTTYLSSNWLAADTSKQTALEYADVRIWLDHTSMTAVVTEGGRVVEHAAYAGSASRKEAHYLGLYDAVLHRPDDPRLGVGLARRIAALLEAAAALSAADVAWSATSEPGPAG